MGIERGVLVAARDGRVPESQAEALTAEEPAS